MLTKSIKLGCPLILIDWSVTVQMPSLPGYLQARSVWDRRRNLWCWRLGQSRTFSLSRRVHLAGIWGFAGFASGHHPPLILDKGDWPLLTGLCCTQMRVWIKQTHLLFSFSKWTHNLGKPCRIVKTVEVSIQTGSLRVNVWKLKHTQLLLCCSLVSEGCRVLMFLTTSKKKKCSDFSTSLETFIKSQ